jgi:tRNA (cmo5U34)-methyltransferase
MSSLDKFNWIAGNYDRLVNVVFGKTLLHAQLRFVAELGEKDKVLILGGGTGNFLKELQVRRPSLVITYVEASSEMIKLAKRSIGDISNVFFIHGTQEQIPDQTFDAIITNFFLDLFPENEIEPLVKSISKHLAPNGKWFVTDFENTQKFSDKLLLRVMYRFFRITESIKATSLPEWRSSFKNQGLVLKQEEYFRNSFVCASVFSKTSY